MINNIAILPEPVEFFLMKGSANDDLITSAVFPGMEEEAYRIRAEEKGITILAGSEKGLKRAEASLSQIRLQCYFGGQAAVPCFRLYDRPKQTERIFGYPVWPQMSPDRQDLMENIKQEQPLRELRLSCRRSGSLHF